MLLEFFFEGRADLNNDQISIRESSCGVVCAGEDASEALEIIAPGRQADVEIGYLARL